ncbi:MAG TPA: SDR family oxidoreductase [Polyangiaceae bacterium LLY-WYZ-15_(1-7)]|nr:epimerase [Myxococcales bacterium]MAT29899.1 epimerase [Sandaracinus sp.]HJK92477.1 SDR family oxidoreductase [Polyangiaceae bacterium LLY-WYZ-15_(1-7)]MBJ72856.1 epimerase [Sandaracinus sp.]HJL04402.1 SDR family oxidoreductase [Polyangiaceae bacterium LLY-WYZ-15_(1-7)]
MSELATEQPVCVTGASGFIGSWIVERLLARGYRVRGTVRDPKKARSVDHLKALPGAAERLELVAAELQDPASLEAAVVGCEVVMHTASPYVLTVDDPQRDLVDPAVEGTRNALAACRKAGSVKRVVLTSSMAAVTDEPDSTRVLTEADWNEGSSLERNPYYYSKTLAEKAAWRFVEEEDVAFDLVVINPFMVIGPSLSPGLNTSNGVFVGLVGGEYPGIVSLTWGMVDVRDVADAHVRAMEVPEASGRYLCANTTISMREAVRLLREKGWGEGRKLPKLGLDGSVGDMLVKLGAQFQPKGVRSYLRTHIGRVPRFDHAKIVDELGLAFRPLEESILETMDDLVKWGHLDPLPSEPTSA